MSLPDEPETTAADAVAVTEEEQQPSIGAEADTVADDNDADGAEDGDTEQDVAPEESSDADGAVEEVATGENEQENSPEEIAAEEQEQEPVAEAETSQDPFSVQQSDEAVHQIVNPLESNNDAAGDGNDEEGDSPLNVVDEKPREQRVQGLPEIFFRALDDGKDPADAFAMVRDTQLDRTAEMARDDMAFGLDAAETAFNDALETGSTPEEAFVMAGDAASRVMASRGFGKVA